MTPTRTVLALLGVAILATLAACASVARPSGADGSRGYLLVANKSTRSLGIVDPHTREQLAQVAEGSTTGHEVATSPDGGTAYVPIYGDSGVGLPGSDGSTLAVIDVAARRRVATLDFGRGLRPHHAVFNPRDGLLYVTTELDQSVTIVDPARLQVVGAVPTGQPESHMLAISRDGRRGYTANVGPGTVSVLDLERRQTLAVIPVAETTQRVSVSADDRYVFTADQDRPRIAVIDAATQRVARWIALPATGFGTAPTPDGRWLVVTMPAANQVAVVDLRSFEVDRVIELPAAPQEPLVRPDGAMVYVSCDRSGKVAAIRTADWRVDALIEVGEGVDGLAWASAAGPPAQAPR